MLIGEHSINVLHRLNNFNDTYTQEKAEERTQNKTNNAWNNKISHQM